MYWCISLITLTPVTHKLSMLHHRSTWRWTLKEDVTNDRSLSGNSYLLKCHNPLHILTSIWSLCVEGPSEGDGIDLSRDSGSINKQQASGFKAEETHLYFSRRVCIWIPEWDVALDRWWDTFFLLNSQQLQPLCETKASNIFLTVGSIKVNKALNYNLTHFYLIITTNVKGHCK